MTYPNKESIRIPMGVNQLKITEEKKLRINENVNKWFLRQKNT